MRSIYDAAGLLTTVLPVVATGTTIATAINGTTVDTQGYNTALIQSYIGILPAGSATLAVTLQESSDNATWSNALDNTGTVIGFTLNAGTVTPAVNSARIEGLGLNRKRYLRGVTTYTLSATTVTATTYAVIALGRAYIEPVRTATSNT